MSPPSVHTEKADQKHGKEYMRNQNGPEKYVHRNKTPYPCLCVTGARDYFAAGAKTMEKKTKVDVRGLPLGDSRIANSLTPEERKKMGWE